MELIKYSHDSMVSLPHGITVTVKVYKFIYDKPPLIDSGRTFANRMKYESKIDWRGYDK